MTINDSIKEIKQSFRQMMDGAIAQSMRNKGVDYKLNWGATLPRLHEMAKEIATQHPSPNTQYDLAIALWKENVRECKILATLLMPIDQMLRAAFPAMENVAKSILENQRAKEADSCLMSIKEIITLIDEL